MKKVTIATLLIVVLLSLWNYFYYYDGRLFIPSVDNKSVCIASVDDKAIYVHDGDELSELTIKGVRVGMSKPGYFAITFPFDCLGYCRNYRFCAVSFCNHKGAGCCHVFFGYLCFCSLFCHFGIVLIRNRKLTAQPAIAIDYLDRFNGISCIGQI